MFFPFPVPGSSTWGGFTPTIQKPHGKVFRPGAAAGQNFEKRTHGKVYKPNTENGGVR
jgi:hypothetical protein